MKLTQEKLEEIISIFNSGKKLSVYDIMPILGVTNKKSVYNALNEIKKQFPQLSKTTPIDKIIYYYFPDNDKPVYHHVTKYDDICKAAILHSLHQQPKTSQQLIDDFESEIVFNLKKTHMYEIIRELQTEGKITKDSHRVLHPIDNTALTNVRIPCQIADDMSFTYALLHHSLPAQLEKVFKKMMMIHGDYEILFEESTSFLLYGRNYTTASQINYYMSVLSSYDYKRYAIQFIYKGKEYKLCIGSIYYSQDKDKCYLIGHIPEEKPNTVSSFPLNSIDLDSISELPDIPNDQYKEHAKYRSYISESFSSYASDLLDVEIEFDYIPYIFVLLYRMSKAQGTNPPQIRGDKIIFSDIIRNKSDFYKFLRFFGSHYKIIKPKALLTDYKNTIERTLSRYEEN